MVILLLLPGLLSQTANAQTQNNNWWTTNGNVYSTLQNGNTLYLSGSFSRVGPNTPSGAAISTTTGSPNISYARPNNTVLCSISDGSGGWYIGGVFTKVGGQVRNSLARINADGSLNAWNPNPNSTVRAMVLSGGVLYAGGNFSTIGGQTRNALAALDTATGNATAWNPNIIGDNVYNLADVYVMAISANGSLLYTGGSFLGVGTASRYRIAAISTATGLPTAWDPNSDSKVRSIVVSGNKVYLGGDFGNIGGQVRKCIAAIDTGNGLATAWNPNASGSILAIAVAGNNVIMGGTFSTIGGQNRNYIAAVNNTTGSVTNWNPSADNLVNALVLSGSTLYVGGGFTNIGSQSRSGLAVLDTSTGLAASWNPNAADLTINTPDGLAGVRSLALAGSTIYAGGTFSMVGGATRNYMAALDATTGIATAWNPTPTGGTVASMAFSGNSVYVGGSFNSIGGQPRNLLAALDPTTGQATNWNPGINTGATVSTLLALGSSIYIGGNFYFIGGNSRNNIAALDTGTGIPTSFNPYADDAVTALASSGNTIYVGGNFANIGGQIRSHIAAVDASVGQATSWNPVTSTSNGATINAICTYGNKLYAGGYFTSLSGQSRNYIAAIDLTTGAISPWNANANGGVSALTATGGSVYAGGSFTAIGGQTRYGIAALDTTAGTATVWNPATQYGTSIATTTAAGGNIYVGGTFAEMSNVPMSGLATFGLPITNPTVSINASATTICSGNAVTFTASTLNTGTSTSYQWTKNNINIASATAITYTATALATGDTIRCTITTLIGATAYTATSNGVGMTVNNCIPVIAALSPATNICQGGSTVISFNASGFNAGNVFTAQLSNAAGGFTSPVAIGTLTSVTGGTITAVLPLASTAAGTAYRIRIVASSPAVTGADNGSNITVIAAPTAAQVLISPTSASMCPGSSVALSVPLATGLSYQWVLSGNSVPGATAATYTATAAGSYTVIATSTQGCSRTSAIKTVTQLTAPTATITPSAAQTVATGQTVTFSVTATSGATYQWYKNGAAITGATSTTYVANASGSYSVIVTNSSGCATSSASVSLTVGSAPTVTIGSISGTSFCQGLPVSVPYTVSTAFNTGNVFTAQLSDSTGSFTNPTVIGTTTATGSGTINATIGSTQATGSAYRIRVVASLPAATSAANTSNLAVLPTPTDAQTQISPSGNITLCAGNTVVLSVPNTTGLFYQWQPAIGTSGASGNSYTTGSAGTYTVTVTNSSGCVRVSAGKVVTVVAAPTAAITPSTTQTLCNGPVVLAATTGSGYTYIWYKNGTATGITTATDTVIAAGNYTVAVTTTSGCTAVSAAVALTANCGVALTNAGTVSRCEGDTITAMFTASGYGATNVFSLQLSDSLGNFTDTINIGMLTGAAGSSITGTIPQTALPGNGYKLRVVTTSPATTGAASPLTIQVRGAITSAINLCAVTVDSATGKNKLIWTKPQDNNIDSFVFYRKNSVAVWARIGAVPYAAYSAWTDSTSDPKALSQRYYLAGKNTCGETAIGTMHHTIHLNINKGTDNNTWNLIWNSYEGFEYSVYNIYRGTTPTTMQLLETMEASGDNSFTDYNAPAGAIYYKITIADGPVCNPGFKTTGTGSGVEIASNIASNGPGFTANYVDMTVYPNPGVAAGTLFIESSDNTEVYTVRIMDITGRLLQTITTMPDVEAAFGGNLAAGLYTVDAVNAKGDKHVVKKWVKQ